MQYNRIKLKCCQPNTITERLTKKLWIIPLEINKCYSNWCIMRKNIKTEDCQRAVE